MSEVAFINVRWREARLERRRIEGIIIFFSLFSFPSSIHLSASSLVFFAFDSLFFASIYHDHVEHKHNSTRRDARGEGGEKERGRTSERMRIEKLDNDADNHCSAHWVRNFVDLIVPSPSSSHKVNRLSTSERQTRKTFVWSRLAPVIKLVAANLFLTIEQIQPHVWIRMLFSVFVLF